MENEENLNMSAFEEMVKKWVVKDHFNPSIKAEVIWDMLLSEFITEIVAFGLGGDLNTEQSSDVSKKDDIFLLAKEFPICSGIKINGKKTLLSAKIDYLLLTRPESEKTQIIMVELKTSNDSFSKTQRDRYVSYLKKENNEKIENFWNHYANVISKYVNKKCYDESPLKLKNSSKYVMQIIDIEKILKDKFSDADTIGDIKKKDVKNKDIKDHNDKIINFLKGKYKEADFKLVYLSLENLPQEWMGTYSNEDGQIVNIALRNIIHNETFEEFLDDNKRCSWKIVSQIIEQVVEQTNFGDEK